MTNQNTLSLWRFDKIAGGANQSEPISHWIYTQSGNIIAGIFINDDSEANARLIAAAPETAAERDQLREVNADLLAALEAVNSAFISGDGAEMQGAIRQARAAIEKAKGS